MQFPTCTSRRPLIITVIGALFLMLTTVATFFGCSLVLDLEECSADEDCGEAFECGEQGLCRERQQECSSDEDCDELHECDDHNLCRKMDVECSSDEDCDELHECDDHNLCREMDVECTSDDHCHDFDECNEEGECIETQREYISSHIGEDTTWTSDTTYVLTDMIMIIDSNTLTIEPGTQIRGQHEAGLVVRRGARIEAEGTRDEPIVFTSDQPVGQRLAGDWAGLALVGLAPTNREDFLLRVDSDEHGKPTVGGSDETWNCGTLRYVRAEFGGADVSVEVGGEMRREKALNGITLAGCGSETTVEYVQSHFSDDDGIVAFGGGVDIRNAVVTRAQNDGFGFDTGWHGTAQYLAVQQDSGGEEAIEIQNLFEDHDADDPISDGQIYNFTLLSAATSADHQVGLYFKRGGRGLLSHGLVQGQPTSGLFVEGAASAQAADSGELTVQNTLFNELGPDGDGYFALIDDEHITDPDQRDSELYNHGAYEDYEGFYDYDQIFMSPDHNNLFGEDPGFEGDPTDLTNPSWVPSGEHTTGGDIDSPPDSEGFDPTGVFRGAFRPDATPWTEGWTDYPSH